MEDANTEPFLSTVSGWEIAIKSHLGKLNCRLICKASLRHNCVSTAFRCCPSRWPIHCMCSRFRITTATLSIGCWWRKAS